MLQALAINFGVLAFCLAASRGRFRLFIAYFTVFLSVNSLAMWHHVLPVSAAIIKGILLLGMVGIAAAWATLLSGASQLTYVRRYHGYALAILFVFLTVMLAGTLYSPEPVYGFDKTRNYAVFSILPTVILVLLGPYTRRQLLIMAAIVVVASLVVAGGMMSVATDLLLGRGSLGEDMNPNNVARNLGSGLLVALLLLVYGIRRQHVVASIALGTTVLALTGALLVTGSRGPLLGAIVSATALLLVTFGLRRMVDLGRSGAIFAVLGIAAVIGAGAVFGPVLQQINVDQVTRAIELTQRLGENRSDYRRLARYEVAAETFVDSGGVGIGTGGFYRVWQGPELGQGITDRDYPHNLFLETGAELGVVGLLVLLAMLAVLARCLVRFAMTGRAPEPHVAAFLGLWLYGLFNAQVSGDLGTNYLVWLGMTLTLLSQTPASTVILPASRPCP